jgi:predicted RNA-binding Zn-ribbon protein involved in translation (DUF1610 family)
MIKKGSRLYSILHFKCPQCHEGDFFVSHPYNLRKAGDLYPKCPNCGLKYEKEVGFYYGAMYASYGLAVAEFVICWVGFHFFLPWVSTFWEITFIITLSILTGPLKYALSKIIWANLFFSYKEIRK